MDPSYNTTPFADPAPRVSVIGAGACGLEVAAQAFELGQGLAAMGVTVVTGGLGGVMEAVCKGARSQGGRTIGILPGERLEDANPYVETAIATGIGHMRNAMVVMNGHMAIAVAGEWGTFSELAFAKKMGKVVVAMGKWSIVPDILSAQNAGHAVALAHRHLVRSFPQLPPPQVR